MENTDDAAGKRCQRAASSTHYQCVGGNMIITIFSADNNAKRSILAVNLATICALNHRKTLLIDATATKCALHWSTWRNVGGVKSKVAVRGTEDIQSELDDTDSYYRTHFQEIIIDAD